MNDKMKNTKQSLVDKTFRTIVTNILDEKYGTMLPPQETLSKDLNVSRTVLREALSIMRTRNMLDIRPKIGTQIRPSNEWLVAIPQSTLTEIQSVLHAFMFTYRCKNLEGDTAYTRASAILDSLPDDKGEQ